VVGHVAILEQSRSLKGENRHQAKSSQLLGKFSPTAGKKAEPSRGNSKGRHGLNFEAMTNFPTLFEEGASRSAPTGRASLH
jgi:hypothetical protein